MQFASKKEIKRRLYRGFGYSMVAFASALLGGIIKVNQDIDNLDDDILTDIYGESQNSAKFKLNTNQNNYEHFLQERQLDYVFKSLSLFSCSKIKSELCCPLQNIKDKCSQIIEAPIYYMDKSS